MQYIRFFEILEGHFNCLIIRHADSVSTLHRTTPDQNQNVFATMFCLDHEMTQEIPAQVVLSVLRRLHIAPEQFFAVPSD